LLPFEAVTRIDSPDERQPDEQARPQASLAQGQQGQPRPQAQRL